MLRRLISAAGIALAALVLPATSASAATGDGYPPDGQPYTVVVNTTNVTVGVAFSVLVTGPDATVNLNVNSVVAPDNSVQIAGVTTRSIVVDADGVVSAVTLPTAGTYTIYVTDPVTGAVISNTVTVTASAAAGGGTLPVTGSTSTPYLVLAGGLLLAGVGALVATRRRAARQR